MAEYGDNPFADPRQTSNPFGQQPGDNPFQPPQPAAPRPNDSAVRSDGLDDFNPFQGPNAESRVPLSSGPASQPAVLPPTEQPPPYYAPSAAQRVNTEDLERRQRELETKAAELQRREEEALRREELAKQSRSGATSQNNWPPLPSFMPCGPCFYQDIDLEIPVEFRSIVKIGYYLWMAHALVLLVNIVGALAYFIGSKGSSDGGTTFGMSILFFLLLTPCSFVCWYRPLYKAFRSDSSFNFFLFFIVIFVQTIILIIQCLGLNWLASCGWLNGISMIGKNIGAAVIMLIIAAMFTLLAIADGLLLVRVHRIYRSTGASFEKAKSEFSSGVMSSPTVRGAAADFGTNAARGAFTGATQPSGGAGTVRY